MSVTVAVTDTAFVVASSRLISFPPFKVTLVTVGAILLIVNDEFVPCVALAEATLYWSTIKTYASNCPSAETPGTVYVHEGLSNTPVAELVHHAPPVQVPFDIAFVLHTSNLTALGSVPDIGPGTSGSDAVASHFTEAPGSTVAGDGVVEIAVNKGV